MQPCIDLQFTDALFFTAVLQSKLVGGMTLTRAGQELVSVVLLALAVGGLAHIQQGSSGHTAGSKAALRDGLTCNTPHSQKHESLHSAIALVSSSACLAS